MKPETDSRLWSIFEQVLALPVAERSAFLDAACGNDRALRQEIEALLRADAREDSFLDETLRQGAVAAEPSLAGIRLGPYRLLEKIGEGGMGVVYRAQREDQAFERSVVVKIARRGWGDAEMARRLRVERQILARLEHPLIARLYDGGTTADRSPYFVMELVDGLPIDEYCTQNALSVARRLALFRQVCAAVSYAHQNLVVHRDLKPSNILVTADGEPKLLDFGIAKLLDPELGDDEAAHTKPWQRVLTPHYASPEQIRGQAVTTASDVYSLGVLLYKLLAGSLPHDFKGRSSGEIERIIDREPLAPSAVAGPLRHELDRDLDSIVLEALRPSASERYPSVGQLDDDVERYQRGLPVKARRGTWSYRSGKLIRRHWLGVGVGLAFLALLITFAGAMVWQSARVMAERDQVRQERDKAQTLLDLILEVFSFEDPEARPKTEHDVTVRDALARSTPLVEQRLQGQPELAGTLLHEIGRIYGNLGHYGPARERLEKALDLRRSLLGAADPRLAATLLALSKVLKEDPDEQARAETLAREALEIFRQHAMASDPALVRPLNNLVSVLCIRDQHARAESLAEEARSLARRLPNDDPERPVAINNLASVRSRLGHSREAVALYRESIALLRTGWGETHPDLPRLLNNLGVELRKAEDLAGAEDAYREAAAIHQQVLGETHPALAVYLNNLAGIRHQREQYRAAADTFERALEILRNTLGEDHPQVLLVALRRELARAYDGEARSAERSARHLLDAWREKPDTPATLIARGESILGEILLRQGRYPEAEALLTRSFLLLLDRGSPVQQRAALRRVEALYERLGRPEAGARYRAMHGAESPKS